MSVKSNNCCPIMKKDKILDNPVSLICFSIMLDINQIKERKKHDTHKKNIMSYGLQ